jgi:hypothetical protein
VRGCNTLAARTQLGIFLAGADEAPAEKILGMLSGNDRPRSYEASPVPCVSD